MAENKRFKMEFQEVSSKELEKEYSYYRGMESCITDNGEFMSYGQIETTLNALYEENQQLHDEVFRLRTNLAYDRAEKEEYYDSVYDFKKKLEKW